MVKKVSLKKEDLKQISGGRIEKVDYSDCNIFNTTNLPKVYEIRDNRNDNLIKIFLDKDKARNFDNAYRHGNTPYRNWLDIFEEFLEENKLGRTLSANELL